MTTHHDLIENRGSTFSQTAEKSKCPVKPESSTLEGSAPFQRPIERRGFLKVAGGVGTALVGSLCFVGTLRAGEGILGFDNAKGMVIGDPTRCVGCRRCEIACTEFKDGKTQPAISRIKVGRNYMFGPKGVQRGIWRGEGRFGNHRSIQDTCLQCPHPVPCLLACPKDAIEVQGPTNARVVNTDVCDGCGMCVANCPFEMISLDVERGVATKCDLCGGAPECVQACPTGALRYVPWRNKTKETPHRASRWGFIGTQEKKESCMECHQ